MLKKFTAALTAVLLSVTAFTGCSGAPTKDDGVIDVVCTVFPAYDWTRQVVGDAGNVTVTYLLSNGSDLHSFQPTADDMIKISDCDVFVYVGGESDGWVDDALKNARNKDMRIVKLIDAVGDYAVEEEIKEGMAAADEDEEEEDAPAYDEHIWLSLNNAQRCVSAICGCLCDADGDNSAKYRDNADYYCSQLQLLDRNLHMLLDGTSPTLIFGDRFPFRYFTEDYGLDYYAAFTGCSADTEASFETVTFLASKADEVHASAIFAIENSDCTIAEAVIANTSSKDQKIAVLDSAQSVTEEQINGGTTYLSVMQKNYDVLKEVLG